MLEETGPQKKMNAKLQEGRNKLIDIVQPYFASRDAAAQYVEKLGLIKPEKVTQLILKGGAEANAQIDQIASERLAMIKLQIQTYGGVEDAQGNFVVPGAGGRQMKADGGMIAYANGGIRGYADGGLNSGIYSAGTPIVKFAEPETRWEAFISGKPGKEARNREVWVEAGRRLGIDATPSVTNNYDWTINLQSTGNTQSDIELIDRELRARRARGGF